MSSCPLVGDRPVPDLLALTCRARSLKGRPAHDVRKTAMTGGIVKWFSDQTGYGFTTADENGEHLFMHLTLLTGAGQGQSSLARVCHTSPGRCQAGGRTKRPSRPRCCAQPPKPSTASRRSPAHTRRRPRDPVAGRGVRGSDPGSVTVIRSRSGSDVHSTVRVWSGPTFACSTLLVTSSLTISARSAAPLCASCPPSPDSTDLRARTGAPLPP